MQILPVLVVAVWLAVCASGSPLALVARDGVDQSRDQVQSIQSGKADRVTDDTAEDEYTNFKETMQSIAEQYRQRQLRTAEEGDYATDQGQEDVAMSYNNIETAADAVVWHGKVPNYADSAGDEDSDDEKDALDLEEDDIIKEKVYSEQEYSDKQYGDVMEEDDDSEDQDDDLQFEEDDVMAEYDDEMDEDDDDELQLKWDDGDNDGENDDDTTYRSETEEGRDSDSDMTHDSSDQDINERVLIPFLRPSRSMSRTGRRG